MITGDSPRPGPRGLMYRAPRPVLVTGERRADSEGTSRPVKIWYRIDKGSNVTRPSANFPSRFRSSLTTRRAPCSQDPVAKSCPQTATGCFSTGICWALRLAPGVKLDMGLPPDGRCPQREKRLCAKQRTEAGASRCKGATSVYASSTIRAFPPSRTASSVIM